MVEVRSSDDPGELYVLRMDGLISDVVAPVPTRTLNVFYSLNNFQYIHMRILDEAQPAQEATRVWCHPPILEPVLSRRLDTRIMENRPEQSGNSGVVIADPGEKRFPMINFAIE
ncbi:MAG: hypothetical protein NTW27_06275 [Deltaproteobacteria bacterium]|nr:hypothetical protein [Deltaproteobacteria bacterium]